MDPRDELEMLRKRKRLAELEAKAASAPGAAPTAAPPPVAAPAPSYPLSSVGINQPADIPGVGLLVNTGEAIRNAGAKAISGYAGLLGTVLPGPEGQGADWQHRTNEKLRGDFTPNKDPLVNVPAQFVNVEADALNSTPVGKGFNNFVSNTPGAPEALEGGMDIATLLGVAQPMNAARSGINASRDAIASSERLMGNRRGTPANGGAVAGPGDNTYLASPAAEASRAGINVTPFEVERQVAGSGESVKGSTRAGFGTGAVNKETAMGNAPRINEIAVRGMPDGVTVDPRNGRIEPQVIEQAKNVERAKYDAVRQVPGDGTSIDMQRGLAGIARGLDNVPENVANDVTRIIRSRAGGGPSTKLVDDIMDLRQEATMDGKRAFNQNDPTARQLAGYKRQIADQLEEELMRRGEAAGLQGVRETLKEARTNFAKLSTLDEALDQGFVDAARLEKVTEGGGYLSDGLADVSRHNQAAPISMTHPQRVGPTVEPNARAGASPTDMALRTAQFLGGNWITKRIGRGGVNALNKELRSFAPPPEAPTPPKPTFDFERAPEPMGPPFPEGAQSPVAPPAPNSAPLGAFDYQNARFATPDQNLELVDPLTGDVPGSGVRSFNQSPDLMPWEDPGAVTPVSPAAGGSFADQLGPTRGPLTVPEGAGMPDNPRGVTGPRSAQLSDPQLSDDLMAGDQPPPRTPDFGPGDEFPGPTEPQGPPPAPGGAPVGVAEPEFMRGGIPNREAADFRREVGINDLVSNDTEGLIQRYRDEFPNGKLPDWDPESMADALRGPPDNVTPIRPKSKPAAVSDELSLAPDNGPARSNVVDIEDASLARDLGLNPGLSGEAMESQLASFVPNSRNRPPLFNDAEFAELQRQAAANGKPLNFSGGAVSDELSLAPDNGPPRSRVDVTEDLPSQGSQLHPHAYKLPKATRIETPEGYIDYVDNKDGTWQVKHTGTRPDMEGRGLAQQREVDLANKAQEAGVTLNSDSEVNPGARRVYEKLIAKGKITADGPFDDGGPVFRNIRPTGGISDTLVR